MRVTMKVVMKVVVRIVIFLRGVLIYDRQMDSQMKGQTLVIVELILRLKPTCVNNKCYEDLDDSNHRSSHFDVEQF